MLDPRAQHLLKTLVERYVAEGQPVGSRVLSRHSGLDLSPATIRNVMADLEEMGLIASPHTSAGRVPTPRGYRFFVDSLMVVKPLEDDEIHRLEGELSVDRPQQLVNAAASLLSQLTQFAGVVDDAEAARSGVPPSRIPATVRTARAADHRHARRRRAEPHPAHRPGLFADPAHRGDELLQPELRRPVARVDSRADGRRAARAARGHRGPDEGRRRRRRRRARGRRGAAS